MTKTPHEIALRKFVTDAVDQMVSFINESPIFESTNFKCRTRLAFAGRRNRSWGGWSPALGPYINLALYHYYWASKSTSGVTQHYEYAHIKTSPKIGEVQGNWQICLLALIAHEVAHAVEHGVGNRNIHVAADFAAADNKAHNVKKHGREWQFIYYVLREKFVNNYKPVDFGAHYLIKQTSKKKIQRKFTTKKSEWTSRSGGAFSTESRTAYMLDGKDVASVDTVTEGQYHPYYSKSFSRTEVIIYTRNDDGTTRIANIIQVKDGKEGRKVVYEVFK